MNHSIENDLFKITVDECGAELCSIISKKTGVEYIWQADKDIWEASAPVLFPIVGALKDGEYQYQEKTYTLPKHGFFRKNKKVKLRNGSEARLQFTLSSDEETLVMYPFKFELRVSFLLRDNRIQVFHELINNDTNQLYFSLGGHPAFAYPWKEGENREDYFIEFDREENNTMYQINDHSLLSRDEIPGLVNTTRLPLTDNLFDKDALIYTELNSSEVTLRTKSSKTKVVVNFDDFPFLGIWSKPKANFVCIEPWEGLPDFENSTKELTEKPGIKMLLPGNTHYASYAIQIFEK